MVPRHNRLIIAVFSIALVAAILVSLRLLADRFVIGGWPCEESVHLHVSLAGEGFDCSVDRPCSFDTAMRCVNGK